MKALTAEFEASEPAAIMERWFLKMLTALSQRQTIGVLPTSDGAVFVITKYASMSVFLAGRELVDDITNIVSHIRAARAKPVATLSELEELIGRTQEAVDILRGEQIKCLQVLAELKRGLSRRP